jgi:hypothetical protein
MAEQLHCRGIVDFPGHVNVYCGDDSSFRGYGVVENKEISNFICGAVGSVFDQLSDLAG